MKLDFIALDKLSISPANMRTGKKPSDIANILPSVRARGILQTLLVRPNCAEGCFEIVAGKRRFYAAKAVAEETGTAEPLPCAIIEAGDDAAALEASLIENIARLDADEVTRWEQFTRLVREGRSVDEIATTFGLPELAVKRTLALGNLVPRIRALYRAEEIDATSIRHLTMATPAQQKAWLALFDDPNASIPKGYQLKAWLFGGASISTSVALFDLDTYEGRIVQDLFEKDGYFGDADVFLTAQMAAVEEKKAAYLASGWSDVVVLPVGERFDRWEHEQTPKRKGGRVYVSIVNTGEAAFYEGFLTKKEAKRVANGEAPTPPKVQRPEVTSAMTQYVDLHRHAAVRSALAAQPSLALRVIVAHAICGSPLWRVEVQSQKSRNESVSASIATSVANARFAERRRAVLAVLGFDEASPSVIDGDDHPFDGLTGVFARLRDLPDPAVMEVLAIVMAETLTSGSRLIEQVGAHIGIDMADYWVADEAFYSLIRDREVLTEILRDVGGDAAANAHAGEKGKTIKGVIADFITGEGRTKREKWVPRWMAFPPSAYTKRGGVTTVAAATPTMWEAEEDAPRDPDPQASASPLPSDAEEDATAEAFEDVEDERLAA